MSQEKPDENLDQKDVDNDLNDILDALNNAEDKIADIPADYDVGEREPHDRRVT